jgi:uroporphyrinogen decarboxylase
MQLSQLKCFKATVEHKKHDNFLFYADFTPDLENRIRKHYGLDNKASIQEHLGMFDPVNVELHPPEELKKTDFSNYYKDINIPDSASINELGVLNIPGSMYHFTRYISPLRNIERLEDIESFPFPNLEKYTDKHMSEEVKTAHSQGKAAFCWVGHIYEASWQIRGYEQFLMDMALRPEWCEFILDKITERNLYKATAAAQAGVDFIQTGDDVANQNSLMFSPEQWRRFMKPRWSKVYSAVKKIKPDIQIWYHSDGNIEKIIPELIEIGVTILNPVQPECLDPVMVKRKYGDKLVIDGTIGTQTTMPFGTPDDVRRIVKERIQTLGTDGALILSPTHILEPEVPIGNIDAFVETMKGLS